MWAIGLLNCINMEAVDMEEPVRSMPRKHGRKGYKGHVFKVLRIKGKGPRKPHLDRPDNPTAMRGHLVRGHFKHYTEDAPLFGKLTGSYYWGAQYRGDIEVGEVYKHYEVEKG